MASRKNVVYEITAAGGRSIVTRGKLARAAAVAYYRAAMSFYARALLRDEHDFGLRGLVEFARADGIEIRVDPAAALDDSRWREAELWAPKGEVPVEIDVSRQRDLQSLLHDEIEEFSEELSDADEEVPDGISTVRQHLAATSAIVAVRVLASDSEYGPAIGNCVLDWYAQRDRILFQVDGHGFYDGETLLVST